MRAPLFSCLVDRLPRPLLVVPLVATALCTTGCPEEPPPPVVARASFKLEAPSDSVTLGESMDIKFKTVATGGKAATGDVIVNVLPVEDDPVAGEGFIGLDEGSADATSLTITPESGAGGFVFRCGTTVGRVRVEATASDTAQSDFKIISCAEATNFFYTIDDDLDANCSRLQADGVSSCQVTLQVAKARIGENEEPVPAADEPVDVEVTEVAEVRILDGIRGVDPDGIPEVLATTTDTPLQSRLVGVQTDAEGNANFLVVSPQFGVSQIVTMEATVRGIKKVITLVFADFQNQSGLEMIAAKSELESGKTTSLSVEARRTDGAPAANQTVTLSSITPTAAIFSAGPGVVVAGGVATVTLDEAGAGRVTLTAPEVLGRGVPVVIQGTYDTGVDATVVPPVVSTVSLSVSERGSVIGNADFSVTSMRSDQPEASQVRFIVTAERDEAPFTNVSVIATVAPDSQALIRFAGDRGGTDAVRRSLSALSAAVAGADGRAEFLIAPVSTIARGTASINVQMIENGNTIFQASRSIIVERDPILQSVVFKDAIPATIGVRGGTLPSTSSITFQLIDDAGNPLAGVPVRFVTNATADRTVTVEQSDISNTEGIVQTTLAAGTIAGPVTVVVTALPNNGLPITVESASIAVVGGLPTFLNSDLACAPKSGRELESTCVAQLVDRFTNRVGANTQVQFRAEGGNITPSSTTDGEGSVSATFRSGAPGHPGTEVRSWSYGKPVLRASQLAGFGGSAACLDGNTSTGCNLLALCTDPDTDEYCPLPGRQSEPDVVPVTSPDGGQTIEVDESRRCDQDLVFDPRACGFPEGCLNGTGEDCPINMGCFDFTELTYCPENGLLTINASARGEESFLDGNGNGILDFVDLNGNGRHESNEPIGIACRKDRADGSPGDPNCVLSSLVREEGACPGIGQPGFNADADATCTDGIRTVDDFIDSPEPFLDKNTSCSRDNFLYASDVNGMSQIEVQVASDLFSDVDGSTTFGFDPERDNIVSQSNGAWDRDTEIFLQTHLLSVGAPKLLFGEACAPSLGQHRCQEPTSPATTSVCQELPDGTGIAPSCNPGRKALQRSGDVGFYLYAWVDGNGNCPTTDFGAVTLVEGGSDATVSAEERTLDALNCGFVAATDSDRPWCKVHPTLGAPALSVAVFLDCVSVVTPDTKISFTLSDEDLTTKIEVPITLDPTTCSDP